MCKDQTRVMILNVPPNCTLVELKSGEGLDDVLKRGSPNCTLVELKYGTVKRRFKWNTFSKLYLSGIEIENGIKSPISKVAPNCTLVELKCSSRR